MAGGSPNWTDIVTATATVVAALGLVGVMVQIRQTRLSREAEVTMDFSRRWDEDLVRKARHCVNNQYATPAQLRAALIRLKAAKDGQYAELLAEPNYYEDLAVMCAHGFLDKGIIRESLGETLYKRWLLWEDAVAWLREADAQNYVCFERLALEMRDRPPAEGDVLAWLRETIVISFPRKG